MDFKSDSLEMAKFIEKEKLFKEKTRAYGTLDFFQHYLKFKPKGLIASVVSMYPSQTPTKIDTNELANTSNMGFILPGNDSDKEVSISSKLYEAFMKHRAYAKEDTDFTSTDIIAALCASDPNSWAGKNLKHIYGENYKNICKALKGEILDKSLADIPQRTFWDVGEDLCDDDEDGVECEIGSVPPPEKGKAKLHSSLINLGELMAKKHPILVGREEIIEEMIEIMQMYNLPNPMLVGPAGSGKTAIVEYLAYLMNQGKIDKKLSGKEILRMDLQTQMSNTSFVGQTETKFNELINSVKDRNAWIYVDETHALIGAGASSKDDNDIPNMLKPHLQDGTIRMIGSTTPEEYKTIEKSAAFNRRLERIDVPALTKLQTIGVIDGLRPRREEFYGVEMKPDYAAQIADGCEKIVGNSPAKEIKVLDRAFVNAARLGASTIDSTHIEHALKKQTQSKSMGF